MGHRVLGRKLNIRKQLYACAGAALLNAWLWMGYYLNRFQSVFVSDIVGKGSAALWFGSFAVLFFVVHGIVWVLERKMLKECNASFSYKRFMVLFFSLAIIWSLHLLLFYPGVMTWDSYIQLGQGLGYVPLTDHHPFLGTLLLGILVRIGALLFGSIYQGILLFTIIQILFASSIAAYAIAYIAEYVKNAGVKVFLFLFFALHPVICAYSVTIWKDVWIAYLILFFAIQLIELNRNEEHFFEEKKKIVLLIFTGILIAYSKKTGIYIISLPLIWMFLGFFKKHKREMIIIVLAVFLGYGVSHHILLDALSIRPGGMEEALSIPVQQIARLVRDEDSAYTLDAEEKDMIAEVLPYDKLEELYNPRVSDPIKRTLDTVKLKSNVGKYVKCYLDLWRKYPKVFWDAWFENSFGYWYPGIEYSQIYDISYLDHVVKRGTFETWGGYDPDASWYYRNMKREKKAEAYIERYNQIKGAPVVGFFFSIAIYFWITAVFVIYLLYKRAFRWLLPWMLVIGVFLTCIISPVFAEYRYTFGAMITVPVLMIASKRFLYLQTMLKAK